MFRPYGYSTANLSNSSIKLMKSSYNGRNDLVYGRSSLPNNTILDKKYWAPLSTSTEYPLGTYLQDYIYNEGTGDLDAYNGRLCVTPEYPSGTYAYFVTVTLSDNVYTPAYPFIIGPSFYGAPVSSNMGPGSGAASVTESTTVFYSYY